MKWLTRNLGLIGVITMTGFSNAAYAACSFDPSTDPAPDRVTDLSGQGNFTCQNIIGSKGMPMEQVAVTFSKDGTWVLDAPEVDINGFVTNSPDDVLLFPQGNGSRCDFSYLRSNAVQGSGLDIGGNVDINDSIACTDGVVNVEVVNLPEPDLVTTTADGCNITLSASTPNGGQVTQADFDLFTASNLDGSIQAVCNADGINQNECVRGCPEFIDIAAVQAGGLYCQPNPDGTVPLTDPISGQRCTPCLTAAEAEATIPGFDTGGLKLCWEYVNGVNEQLGSYTSHRAVRSQTTETDWYNACYETTTTVNFFGREITKTITTCD